MKQELTLAFGGGVLVGSAIMSIMNHKQTVHNFKKLYEQITINNVTAFCGTVWITSSAYDFCFNCFHKYI